MRKYFFIIIIIVFTSLSACTQYPSDEEAIKLAREEIYNGHNNSMFRQESSFKTKNQISKEKPLQIDKIDVVNKYEGLPGTVQFKFLVTGTVHTFAYKNDNYHTGIKIDKGIEKFEGEYLILYLKENGKWRTLKGTDIFEFKAPTP